MLHNVGPPCQCAALLAVQCACCCLQAKKGKREKGPGGGWYNVADASDFQVRRSNGLAVGNLYCSLRANIED